MRAEIHLPQSSAAPHVTRTVSVHTWLDGVADLELRIGRCVMRVALEPADINALRAALDNANAHIAQQRLRTAIGERTFADLVDDMEAFA